jgi:ATP adenylyltransferase
MLTTAKPRRNLEETDILMTECDFCKERDVGFQELKDDDVGDRILYSSENLLVFPSLGQIVEGYLLIVTKQHHISFGAAPEDLYPELEAVQDKVRDVLTRHYCAPLFFEHGPASENLRGGCCVDHAHIHAVPAGVSVFDDLAELFRYSEMDSYDALKQKFNRGEHYFFLEEDRRRYLFSPSPHVPSQLIRMIMAEKVGNADRWDWRTCPELDMLQRTLDRLKGTL